MKMARRILWLFVAVILLLAALAIGAFLLGRARNESGTYKGATLVRCAYHTIGHCEENEQEK